jgi:gamma-glutamylcyclotransferase (GGCT)/AIG2-like uncharacterized protein YtfP
MSNQDYPLFSSQMFSVFVYGTLKPGEAYYDRFCGAKVLRAQTALSPGQLYLLPEGYAAMTAGPGFVKGYVLTFTDPTVLTELDEFEDYHPDRPLLENEYIRQKVETFDLNQKPQGSAWGYLMLWEQIERLGGILLPDGCWTGTSLQWREPKSS